MDFQKYYIQGQQTVDKNRNNHIEFASYKFVDKETEKAEICFVIYNGVTTVSGDYGNWVFNKPLHPSKEWLPINIPYLLEKLRMYSTQQPCVWDEQEALAGVNEWVKCRENITDEEIDWAQQLIYSVETEHEYIHVAYYNKPESVNTEDVPISKKLNPQLVIVFQAFEHICKKMI